MWILEKIAKKANEAHEYHTFESLSEVAKFVNRETKYQVFSGMLCGQVQEAADKMIQDDVCTALPVFSGMSFEQMIEAAEKMRRDKDVLVPVIRDTLILIANLAARMKEHIGL